MSNATLTRRDVYDAGDFKKGDRVIVTTDDFKHKGAPGVVTRVDGPDEIYPIVVWLDVFGPRTDGEIFGEVGAPMHAGEVERASA